MGLTRVEQRDVVVQTDEGQVQVNEESNQVHTVVTDQQVRVEPDGSDTSIQEDVERFKLTVETKERTTVRNETSVVVVNVEQVNANVVVENRPILIETATVGPQGPPAPRSIFIQPDSPTGELPRFIWFQTEIGADDDFTLWIEDGT